MASIPATGSPIIVGSSLYQKSDPMGGYGATDSHELTRDKGWEATSGQCSNPSNPPVEPETAPPIHFEPGNYGLYGPALRGDTGTNKA